MHKDAIARGAEVSMSAERAAAPPDLQARLLLSGRIVYAVAIIGFGALCLIYRDFISSLQPVPTGLPGYSFLAVLTGLFLVLSGLAILADFRLRTAALALAAMFALGIVALHIPDAVREPAMLRSPFWIRTFESLALAGAALILAGLAGDPRREWIRAGRILFGVSLPVFGVLHFIYPESVAILVPAWYPWPLFLAYLSGAGHFAAGVAIATGVLARLGAVLAGMMYALWVLTLHLPRVIDHPAARTAENPAGYAGDWRELASLFVCVAFWGAAWVVAGCLDSASRDPASARRESGTP